MSTKQFFSKYQNKNLMIIGFTSSKTEFHGYKTKILTPNRSQTIFGLTSIITGFSEYQNKNLMIISFTNATLEAVGDPVTNPHNLIPRPRFCCWFPPCEPYPHLSSNLSMFFKQCDLGVLSKN